MTTDSKTIADRYLKLYSELDDDHRFQLEKLRPRFENDSSVREKMAMFSYPPIGSEERKRLTGYIIHKTVSPLNMANSGNFDAVYAYCPGHPRIRLQAVAKPMTHGYIYRGRNESTNQPVMVKIYYRTSTDESGVVRISSTTLNENVIYERLGSPPPCISTSYKILGIPCLIMKPFNELTSDIDEHEMGIQVIRQLRPLHQFGVHCDLKPGNILQDPESKLFYVIDYGGVATKRLGHGFERHIWSPKWTSQIRRSKGGNKIICTAKNDMIELLHAMNTIRLIRKGVPISSKGPDLIRTDFSGKLKKFYEYAIRINDKNGLTDSDRDELIRILSEPCDCRKCRAKRSETISRQIPTASRTIMIPPQMLQRRR